MTRGYLLLAVGAIALVALAWLPWPARLLYNPSPSAPQGWYLLRSVGELRSGDRVLVRLPEGTALLADERGYLPQAVPLLKRIGAVAGQYVCGRGQRVWIDGRDTVGVQAQDRAGRPLGAWAGCRTLQPGELFLLAPEASGSFDSRYFGPVMSSTVLGKAVPLWTW